MPSNRIEDVLPKRVIDWFTNLSFPMLKHGFILSIMDMTDNFMKLKDERIGLIEKGSIHDKYKRYLVVIIDDEQCDKDISYIMDKGYILDDYDYTYYKLTPLDFVYKYGVENFHKIKYEEFN